MHKTGKNRRLQVSLLIIGGLGGMNKLYTVLFACLSVLIMSCANQRAPEKSIVKYPLTVEIDPSMDQFQKGVPSKITFYLTNNSDDLIVIRALDIEGGMPDITRWYGSRYGSTSYKPLEDIWEYYPLTQSQTEPVFVTSLIVPGGKIKITRTVVFKNDQAQIEVGYHRLAKDQIKEYLYLATKNADYFRQTNIFKHPESTDGLFADHAWSTAILPDDEKLAIYSQKISMKVKLNDSHINLIETYGGEKVIDYVIWKSQNALVIKTAKGIYFVKDSKVDELGRVDLKIFSIIPFKPITVGFILPLEGYEEFEPVYPSIEGPGYFSPGVTEIVHYDILRLFEFAKEKGHAISVVTYDSTGLGNEHYIVVGSFDEEKRRDYIKRGNM